MRRYFFLKFLFILSVFSLFANYLYAQNSPSFNMDYACFETEKRNIMFLEIYYSIDQNSLTYQKDFLGYHAQAEIRTYIIQNFDELDPDSLLYYDTKSGKVLPFDSGMLKYRLMDSLDIKDFVESMDNVQSGEMFVDLSRIKITQGHFILFSMCIDCISGKTSFVRDELNIEVPLNKKLTVSDIELGISIFDGKDKYQKFAKDSVYIIPHPKRAYGEAFPELYYYAEIYNLAVKGRAKGTTFKLSLFILDAEGNKLGEINHDRMRKPEERAVIYGGIDVKNLAPGFYKFKIVVQDEFNGKIAEKAKSFYVTK